MTKYVLLTRIAAIITTLDETNGSPESMLYIFCGMDMQAYEAIRDILVEANLVTIKGHYVTLTSEGKITAAKINAAIAKKES